MLNECICVFRYNHIETYIHIRVFLKYKQKITNCLLLDVLWLVILGVFDSSLLHMICVSCALMFENSYMKPTTKLTR